MADDEQVWPVAPKFVDDFIGRHSARGGVTLLAQRLKSERRVYVEDPGENPCIETPAVHLRCQDRHPGLCLHTYGDVALRAKEIAGFLHTLQRSNDHDPPEPMMLLAHGDDAGSTAGIAEHSVFQQGYGSLLAVALRTPSQCGRLACGPRQVARRRKVSNRRHLMLQIGTALCSSGAPMTRRPRDAGFSSHPPSLSRWPSLGASRPGGGGF